MSQIGREVTRKVRFLRKETANYADFADKEDPETEGNEGSEGRPQSCQIGIIFVSFVIMPIRVIRVIRGWITWVRQRRRSFRIADRRELSPKPARPYKRIRPLRFLNRVPATSGLVPFRLGRTDFGNPLSLAQARGRHFFKLFNRLECFRSLPSGRVDRFWQRTSTAADLRVSRQRNRWSTLFRRQ